MCCEFRNRDTKSFDGMAAHAHFGAMPRSMNRAAHLAQSDTHFAGEILALEVLRAAPVTQEPFPFFIVPRFVRAEALDAIRADFPAISHPGSFPLTTLEY